MEAMTRDQARAMFHDAGLTFDVVTKQSIQRLRALIQEHMGRAGLINGSLRCRQRGVVRNTPLGRHAEIRCCAYYFDGREAVTFNRDGFIGFAGWADDRNVQPILAGFADWVRELTP